MEETLVGFESFRVELGGGPAKYGDADEAIRQSPHVKPDTASFPMQGSTYYLIDDGQHVIEVELMDSPVHISCRFTLCHPPSVDLAFLGLVRDLMLRLGMQVRICDDVRAEHAQSFTLANFGDFASVTSGYIAARRAEWIAAFGNEPMSATTNEVCQRVILPRCQPGTQQPTVTT
jgi:hypothetical protein